MREALFNVLGAQGALRGANVLDLYAGTGALAFEALSRGAERATLVEDARDALAAIRANVGALGLAARVRVVASRVERCVRALDGGPFDLVFADPPYADVANGEVARALAGLVPSVLAPGATFVLEHGKDAEPPVLEGLERADARRYGDTSLALYVRR